MAGRRAAAAVPLLCWTLLSWAAPGAAMEQSTALQLLGNYLTNNQGVGWGSSTNPCDGSYSGVTCGSDGTTITAINLSGKTLKGSLPVDGDVWGSFPGLTYLNVANSGLGGAVPEQVTKATALTQLDVSGNPYVCGGLPTGLLGKVNSQGTAVGVPCDVVDSLLSQQRFCVCSWAPGSQACIDEVYNSCRGASSPHPACQQLEDTDQRAAAVTANCGGAATPPPGAAVPPGAAATPPGAAATPPGAMPPTTTPGAVTPPPAAAPLPPAAPPPVVAPPPPGAPPRPPVAISSAPICSCALKGFSAPDCTAAFSALCTAAANETLPTSCAAAPNATTDSTAAATVADFLQVQCFTDQTMDASACECFSNLGTSDCAKARVALCLTSDALCLPFQSLGTANSSANASAAVAAFAAARCPVPAPTQAGVQVTMLFANTSVADYIAGGYTQGAANALSSAAGVPSSAVSTLDVRPHAAPGTGTAAAAPGSRRRLLQEAAASGGASAGAGVQATYYVASDTPDETAARLQAAAQDGSLATQLNNNGVMGSPTITLKPFVGSSGPPTAATNPPNPGADGGGGGSSFPLWAIAPIVVGALLLLGLFVCLWLRSKKKKRPVATSSIASDVAHAGVATKAGGGYYGGGAAAANNLPVSKSVKAAPLAAAAAAGAAATAAAAAPPPPPAGSLSDTNGSRATTPATGVSPLLPRAASRSSNSGPTPLPPPGTAPAAGDAAAGVAQRSWRTNVRPATPAGDTGEPSGGGGAEPPGAAGVGSMSSRPGTAQAERAKFWAQFQETWQQVRATKGAGDEPGTPSSGTEWTESHAGSPRGGPPGGPLGGPGGAR